MTALDALLAEVEALDEAATPGPWRPYWAYQDPKHLDTGVLVAATHPGHQVRTDAEGGTMPSADLAFIARDRTLLPVLREIVRVQRKALDEYSTHDNDCIRSHFEGGRPTNDGGYEYKYAGEWYEARPVDRAPPCDCGFDAALALAEALAQEVRDAAGNG